MSLRESLYIYTRFSPSLVDTRVQIIGGLFALGLSADMTYASLDGDELLLRLAKRDMHVTYNIKKLMYSQTGRQP